MEKPWGICSSNQIVGILNRPEPPPEPLIVSRSRGPNAQFGSSATPLFKILKKEWRPRQAAPDPPPGSPLSRILEGGACSGVVAPGLGEMGERGGTRRFWRRGRVVWAGGSGGPGAQGALKNLRELFPSLIRLGNNSSQVFSRRDVRGWMGCVMCALRVSRCECVHMFRPRSRVRSAPTAPARHHVECLTPALAVCAAWPHEPLATGTGPCTTRSEP